MIRYSSPEQMEQAMTATTVNIQLPDEIYERLKRAAATTNQPFEVVLAQTIRGNLPPTLDDLSPALRAQVADLSSLDDTTLWSIAREPVPVAQWRRHRLLLRKAQDGALPATEQDELAELRAATDRFVLRRSYALALLKWRGHTIPATL